MNMMGLMGILYLHRRSRESSNLFELPNIADGVLGIHNVEDTKPTAEYNCN